MKSKLLKLITLLICSFIFTNLSAQKNGPELSFGILNADIKSFIEYWEKGNPWRKGAWVSLNQNHKIFKWLHLDTGITYQERMPLEVFTFPFGSGLAEGVSGVSTRFTFEKWPSSPQHELFDPEIYVRIPNFKYLNVEIVPNITIGNTFSVTIGAGLFGGVLLNRDATTITKEDLPYAASFFEPTSYNVYGEVTYHKYDSGFMPKAAIAYKINDKIKVGLMFKSYHSFIRLNDTFVEERNLALNMRWVAHAGGLSVQYKF